MYTATFYEPRQKCFNFFQVRCAHKSDYVINFIILACGISLRLKWYKNYENRLRLAKVIVKNKMSRFLWFTVYMLADAPPNASKLSESRKAVRHGSRDVGTHGNRNVAVEIDSEVAHTSNRLHRADAKCRVWQAVLLPRWRTPHEFRFGCIQLQSVRLHPLRHTVDTSWDALLEVWGLGRCTETTYLNVIRVEVGNRMQLLIFNEFKKVCRIQKDRFLWYSIQQWTGVPLMKV